MGLDKSSLKGIYPALVTPTDSEGKVNKEATRTLLSFLVEAGVSGVVPLGGTGEFTNLAPSDRASFVELVVEEIAGRVPVVSGILSPGFGEALATGMDFKKAGTDAIMLVTPFYVKPTQEGMREYFNEFVARVDLPVIIYDIPYRTGVSLDPATIRKMVDENEKIIGMKACNTDLAYFTRLMAQVGDSISVLSGEEYMFMAHMILGAKGGVLATCNLFPHIWIRMYDLLTKGDVEGAKGILYRLVPFLDAAFAEMNPGPLKAAMTLRGFDVGPPLRPLVKPNQETMNQLEAALQALLDNPPE